MTLRLVILVVSCVYLVTPANALAQLVSPLVALGLHVASLHSEPGFEGNNPGVFVRWANGTTVGALRNSYGNTSFYGGWLWTDKVFGRYALFLGAASGYGNTEERRSLVPILGPSARFEISESIALRLTYFPEPRQGGAQVLHLNLEFPL
jgi:hypothetical protein